MREKILAVVDELKRLKAEGEEFVFVSTDSVASLNAATSGEKSLSPAIVLPAAAISSPRPQPSAPLASSAAILPDASAVRAAPTKSSNVPVPSAEPKLPPPPAVTLPEGDKRARWEYLRELVLNCPVCKANLNAGAQVVFGNGSLDADIFFCGEAPGADEEVQGIPFVGRAGQLLVKIIGAMGLSREQVYIGNIMNWRPQTGQSSGNRPPTGEEMAFCLPYLQAQIEVVKPKLIVALGNTAVTGLMGPDTKRKLGQIRGKWFDFRGTPLMPTYHPSYVLQYGSNTVKRQIWEDMLAVMEKVGMPISEKQQGYFR